MGSCHQCIPGTFCIACALLCCPSNRYQRLQFPVRTMAWECEAAFVCLLKASSFFSFSSGGLRDTSCYNVTFMCPFSYLNKALLFLCPTNFCPFSQWFIRKEGIEKNTRGSHPGSSKALPPLSCIIWTCFLLTRNISNSRLIRPAWSQGILPRHNILWCRFSFYLFTWQYYSSRMLTLWCLWNLIMVTD